jgi:hypothetical protein
MMTARVNATSGPANVARTGRTEFETAIADAVLRQITPELERLRLLSQLDLGTQFFFTLPC